VSILFLKKENIRLPFERIEARASGPGGNSIFQSMRPGSRSAGSKISDSIYPLIKQKMRHP
jgi:hypothetical protein